MTERLNCGNCGGPLTRQASESSIKCAHCEHVTEVGSPPGSDDDDDDDSGGKRDRGQVPAIIVINAGGGGSTPQRQVAPVTRTVVVSRGSSFSFITPIIFIAIAISASVAIRRHIMNSIPSIPSPPAAAAGAPPAAGGHEPAKHEEPKKEEPKKDDHGKHGH